jgi:hypothetical protein
MPKKSEVVSKPVSESGFARVTSIPDKPKIEPKPPSRKDVCLKEIQDILAEYNMLEGNIPWVHKYWDLQNEFRGLSKNS